MLQLIFALIISLFALAIILSFLIPYFFGAPFEPMPKSKIEEAIKLAGLKKGSKVVDLGSGKGDVVIELAKAGINAYGYEINPFLFLYSWLRIKKLKLKNAKIKLANFWNQDLSCYDAVILFQIGYIMARLEKKLKKELKEGAKVISYYWKFPNWKPIKSKGRLYLYRK